MKETALPSLRRTNGVRTFEYGVPDAHQAGTVHYCNDSGGLLFRKGGMWNISILGTDISMDALRRPKGRVFRGYAQGCAASLKDKYFQDLGNGSYRVSDRIRRNVTFRPLNLNEDFFSRPFDIIFCRNVMIYFDNITRKTDRQIL